VLNACLGVAAWQRVRVGWQPGEPTLARRLTPPLYGTEIWS